MHFSTLLAVVCLVPIVFGGRVLRHDHSTFDSFAKEHLEWMTDEERAEIKKLGETDKPQAVKKVMEILNASADEKKNKGVAQLQAACRHLIVDTLGEDAAKDLRTQKESGATTEELSKKVSEMLTGITDEQKKAKALEYKETCEKVYGMASSAPAPVAAQAPTRKIRHAAHHDLEAKLRNEWKWLTDEQKEELRKFVTDGKNDEYLLTKVFEYFKNAEDKEAAEDGLQSSCSSAILTILGPEKAEELKTFMANGAKPDAYEAKVKELLSSAPPKTLTKNQESCKTVFTSASR